MRIGIIFFILISYLFLGTLGYRIIEGWNFIDSFYMSVITLTTVGFREVYPLSNNGKIFTSLYILFGLGFFYYAFFTLFEFVFKRTSFVWYKRTMESKIKKLKNHYIVCGFGRMGSYTVNRLLQERKDFVVIENNPELINELREREILFIEGDAREEDILLKANIKNAKALASLLPDDADNLYVIITAKELNPKIFIVTKASDKDGERRLLKAGAHRVILPYEEAGSKIALSLLRPNLREFIELAHKGTHLEYQVEELYIDEKSPFKDKTLRESGLRREYGMIAVGIVKKGKLIFNPEPDTKIEKGDILILLGEKEGFEKLIS